MVGAATVPSIPLPPQQHSLSSSMHDTTESSTNSSNDDKQQQSSNDSVAIRTKQKETAATAANGTKRAIPPDTSNNSNRTANDNEEGAVNMEDSPTPIDATTTKETEGKNDSDTNNSSSSSEEEEEEKNTNEPSNNSSDNAANTTTATTNTNTDDETNNNNNNEEEEEQKEETNESTKADNNETNDTNNDDPMDVEQEEGETSSAVTTTNVKEEEEEEKAVPPPSPTQTKQKDKPTTTTTKEEVSLEQQQTGSRSSPSMSSSSMNGSAANNSNKDGTTTSTSGSNSDSKTNQQQPPPDSKTTNTNNSSSNTSNDPAKTTATTTDDNPAPPIMKGTLSIDNTTNGRRHLIRGNWNYDSTDAAAATVFEPQRFELSRYSENTTLPENGEFKGSFSLSYLVKSKGREMKRSKLVHETGVQIEFIKQTRDNSDDYYYTMQGTGTNQFGLFHLKGTATPSPDPTDPTLSIQFHKTYVPGTAPAAAATNELPDPSPTFEKNVVALRGELSKVHSESIGLSSFGETTSFKIIGHWAAGLDVLNSDPDNVRGLVNRFEYEHKSSKSTKDFPVSGKYSGWFDLSNEDGTRTRINERDVTLKFRLNKEQQYNVEGKGSNVFGKYTITGQLDKNSNVLTIFRHFQPRKVSTKKSSAASNSSLTASSNSNSALVPKKKAAVEEPLPLSLADVILPPPTGSTTLPPPIANPASGTYSAVSRGILRVNTDGSHSCSGQWAVAREHLDASSSASNLSNFTFRLEAHFATGSTFPTNSHRYKGSFQLKKTGGRHQTIMDQQIVMKFQKNKQGSYNVHGKGVNNIGEFNLIGTLVIQGQNGGQVELYRLYPPDKLKPTKSTSTASTTTKDAPKLPGPPTGPARQLSRRPSKLPPRLEEDNPSAQLSRSMDKCLQILESIRQRDLELGGFFKEPVDPVKLGIPTYFSVVSEPMDLRTVHRRMEARQIDTPEEFQRLVKLVFENAIKFNVDPNHSVHVAARTLMVQFNQKFRDVERMVQSIRREHGLEVNKKGDKKRKRAEEVKSIKRIRLEEAQAMSAANARSMAALVSAAPSTANLTTVTRSEFTMMLHMIQQLQEQMVQTHTALAELSPGDPSESAGASGTTKSSKSSKTSSQPAEKKKATKRKSSAPPPQPAVFAQPVVDDSAPLSLEEKEFLTDTINGGLPDHQLGVVIQIIREAGSVDADSDEIDVDVDQLDTKAQRKLFQHISKFVKKFKQPKSKTKKTKQPAAKKAKPAPKPKKAAPKQAESFFSMDASDSDSDDEPIIPKPAPAAADFKLGDSLGELDDDENDDDDDVGMASWNIAKPDQDKNADDDKDDDWGAAAREQAAAAKARDADRKAREEKKKLEAEEASRARLKEAAARGEEIKVQRAEEEAKEAEKREQDEKKEKAALEEAKKKAQEELEGVEQTVDFDAQRDMMKQFDDLGGASPSSDFGF